MRHDITRTITRVRRRLTVAVAASALAMAAPGLHASRLTAQVAPGAPPLVHESWTVARGLPVNSISQIVQGSDGYLWLTTFDGLVRFDGARFTVFTVENSKGLPSSRLVHLHPAKDGALWLFTEQQQVVRFHRGAFTHYAALDGQSVAMRQRIAEGPAGRIWIASLGRLYVFDGTRFTAVDLGVGRNGRARAVTSLLVRHDGSLLVATEGPELLRVPATGAVQATPVYEGMLPAGGPLFELFEDADRSLWLYGGGGTLRHGTGPFATIATQGNAVFARTLHTLPNGQTWVQGVNGTFILRDDRVERRLASGYFTASQVMWREANDIWYAVGPALYRNDTLVYRLAPDWPGGTPSPYLINTVLRDREGNIWLGTDAAGLHRLSPALFRSYSKAEGLANQNVHPVFVDRDGKVWTGAWGDGISRLDPRTGRAEAFGTAGVGLPAHVNSFLQDDDGTLWLGTSDERYKLMRCAPPLTMRNCRHDPLMTPEDAYLRVVALFRDASGTMWAGTSGGVFRRTATGWQRLQVPVSAATATVRAFAQTRDGALWMATDKSGVLRFAGEQFTSVTTRDGLPIDAVRALYVDASDYLWIGTEGRGMAGLDPREWSAGDSSTRRVISIGRREGLFDNVVHAIVPDDRDRLWMSSNRGIFWLSRRELADFVAGRTQRVHSTGYTERDGMRNREANGGVQPAASRGADGRIWFATQDGVVVVNPADVVRPDARPLQVLVESVTSRDSAVAMDNGSVRLDLDQRDVQLSYTALTFTEPQNVRFRYRLEGYDTDWVDAGDRRVAFYTKVPPGTYTFRVQASMPGGDWPAEGAALRITVTPSLWERPLFRIVLGVLLALGVLVSTRWRLRIARGRARVLEDTVAERTRTLQERERELAAQNALLEQQARQLQALDRAKTRFFANVSHELRTPLTLTIGPLEDLRNEVGDDERVSRWLDIAQRNARRLLRLVNQILDVAKLEAGEMRLTLKPFDLVPFVRGLVSAFAPVADRKKLQLQVQAPDAIAGRFDPDALEKILTNLVSNAVKFTPDGGRVLVTMSVSAASGDEAPADGATPPSVLEVHVADTGNGIPPEQLAHVFERFYQVDEAQLRLQPGTGIGLALVKELVELHGGTISAASDVRGTVFSLRIPFEPLTAAAKGDGESARMPDLSLTPVTGQWLGASASAETDGDPATADVRTLLIVDDSSDLRAYVRSHFIDRFRVIEAADGDEGVAIARRELPDVVLSDVMMPGRDGHELVKELRAHADTDFLPVILLTAQADGEQRIAGLEHGADDYIVKPFEMRELELRVRNLITSRERLREHLRERLRNEPVDHASESPATMSPVENALASALAAATLSESDRAWLIRLEQVIHDRLGEADFGVAEMADAMNTDRTTLFRRTRQLVSLPPSELLRQSRLIAGSRLLVTERSSTVADVAYTVGFNSVSHFCHSFQQQFGKSPATYRSEHATPRS